MRQSIARHVDKKPGVPKEEKPVQGSQGEDRGLEFSRKRKGQTFFSYNARTDAAAAASAESHQLYLTLCDPTDGSPPGSPVPGILQAGTLEWVAISFSNA